MSTVKLIGITGQKRSGKNTVASIIRKIRPEFNREYAVADPLKQACKAMFGLSNWELENKDTIIKRLGISTREILQKIGTDVVRDTFLKLFPDLKPKNLWLYHLQQAIDDSEYLIVPDIRFPDEAKVIEDNGGIIIRVVRNNDRSDKHESESHINEIPASYTIINNGTLKTLEKTVNDVLPWLI
jgi:hypothetical protein